MRFLSRLLAPVAMVIATLLGSLLTAAPAVFASEAAPVASATQAAPAHVPLSLAPGQAAGFGDDVGTAAYGDCPVGYICFWSGENGQGLRCTFGRNYPDVFAACSWIRNEVIPHSVYNRTAYRYHYYLDPGYKSRIGSTVAGDRGNLSGRYLIGSLCRHNSTGCPN
ncbi:peptidase inhibitor family I36 protein [Streptomyces sp. WMMC500]|uniref:peptidase inhibitor family I36 protein n=1 Tax=Streptomyces sp. WMMC500 TaxID=3015154 RepID=UPI00248BCF1D|nr:peptidase inhibitor family I36 protein [Streptomyces sp. WMMC500]WBB62767.1 peptidase inhibitor family I36 protein [Streptomyces sp. WMMC500]